MMIIAKIDFINYRYAFSLEEMILQKPWMTGSFGLAVEMHHIF